MWHDDSRPQVPDGSLIDALRETHARVRAGLSHYFFLYSTLLYEPVDPCQLPINDVKDCGELLDWFSQEVSVAVLEAFRDSTTRSKSCGLGIYVSIDSWHETAMHYATGVRNRVLNLQPENVDWQIPEQTIDIIRWVTLRRDVLELGEVNFGRLYDALEDEYRTARKAAETYLLLTSHNFAQTQLQNTTEPELERVAPEPPVQGVSLRDVAAASCAGQGDDDPTELARARKRWNATKQRRSPEANMLPEMLGYCAADNQAGLYGLSAILDFVKIEDGLSDPEIQTIKKHLKSKLRPVGDR